jgi:PAS domain S-box-containing protein
VPLHSQTERLSLALAAGKLGDWSWDAQSDIVTFSGRAAEIFQIPAGPHMTWTALRDLLHPADAERARVAVEVSLTQHTDYDIEYRLINGAAERVVSARGRGVYGVEGAVIGMIGVVQDITEQVRTRDALRVQAESLETINHVGRMLAAELDLEKLVQSLTDAATELTEAEFGAFFYNVLDERGGSYMLYALSGVDRAHFANFPMPRATDLFGPTFRGEGIIRLVDVRQDSRFGQNPPYSGMPVGHLPVVSYLAVPVVSRTGEVLGGLFFGHSRPGVFTERAEHIVSGLAGQAATAIDNARLFEAAKRARQAAEETNTRNAADASALTELHRLSSRLWQMQDLRSGLEEMLTGAIKLLGADMGNIQLLDEQRQVLLIHAHRGFQPPFLQYFAEVTTADESACGRTLRAGERTVIEDVETDEPYAPLRPVARAAGYRGVVTTPLMGRSGRPIGMLSSHFRSPHRPDDHQLRLLDLYARQAADFIERLHGDAALRDNEQRYRTLFDTIDEGFCIIEFFDGPHGPLSDYVHVEANPAYERHAGISDVVGQKVREMVPDEADGWVELYRRVLVTGEPIRFERELVATGRHLELSAFRVEPESRRQVAVLFQDVTARRRAEHALREREEEREYLLQSEQAARVESERASRMKDEFLATLSHEIRTPLNAILGWAALLRAGRSTGTDAAQGLEIIERNARLQAQMIEDLLDMSRIISGKLRLDVQRVDLADVIRTATEAFQPAATAKEIRLQLVLDPLTGLVSGDPNRLQQVLWNLLSNAIKFTPKGGRVQVLLERVNSHVEISVIDTGEGIDPAFLPEIFDRFRQADSTTTRRHGGLGLGLAIVKQLVELHGGTIRAKSPGKNQGATFVAALPLTVLHPEVEPLPSRRHPRVDAAPVVDESCLQLAGVRVLVVDDEPDARALLRRLFEECEAVVSLASSSEEALSILQTQLPDVLISDIGMPGDDGYSLIRRVRALPDEKGGRIPAIALTAYARIEDRVKSMVSGFQHHLSKPIEPTELIAVVARLVDSR